MPVNKNENKNAFLEKLGQNIKKYRLRKANFKGKPFTQFDLAFASGLSYSQIGHLEVGKKNISITNLIKVAAALDITVSELCEGIDQKLDN